MKVQQLDFKSLDSGRTPAWMAVNPHKSDYLIIDRGGSFKAYLGRGENKVLDTKQDAVDYCRNDFEDRCLRCMA